MNYNDDAIHVMDGNKISKQFIIAVVSVLSFVLILGYIIYISSHRYDVFLETISQQKMTLINAEEPINARDISCPYQIHFEAINASGKKVKARYCAGSYFSGGEINIKGVLKD